MERYLTKSKFKLGLECPTKLYYLDRAAEYFVRNETTAFTKALVDAGYQVDALAKCYFPTGIYIKEDNNTNAIAATLKQLQKKSVSLFEAAIKYENYFVRVDILVKEDNNLNLIEIKSKSIDKNSLDEIKKMSAKWKPYIEEVAFQKWVLQKSFPNYNVSAFLMMMDKDSVCPTDGLNQKFLLEKDKNETPRVKIPHPLSDQDLSIHLLKEINIDEQIDLLWNECVERGMSFNEQFENISQCYFNDEKSKPIPKKECATCEFKITHNDNAGNLKCGFKECWKEALHFNASDFNEPTILDLWNFRYKNDFLKKGLIKLKDLNESDLYVRQNEKRLENIPIIDRQWLQIEKIKKGDNTHWLDTRGLKNEIESWIYPFHFIDFETAMLTIPFKKGMHPYQGIAFQYSHHTLDKDGTVTHFNEFLNTDPGVDPSLDFIRSLKNDLQNDNGTIFRYGSHENTYLNYILSQIETMAPPIRDKEELCLFIKSITKPTNKIQEKWEVERGMIDLLELVKKFYYDPITNGSNSIKNILFSILNRSKFLQKKYQNPIYGGKNGIFSKNFKDKIWIVYDEDRIKNPYLLLDPINKEMKNEEVEYLFDDEYLKEGGAATIAYMKLQFSHMNISERDELRRALLRYCELDTLGMVMIIEAWKEMVS